MTRRWWLPVLVVLALMAGVAFIVAIGYGVYRWAELAQFKEWDGKTWAVFGAGIFAWLLISALGAIRDSIESLIRTQERAAIEARRTREDITAALFSIRSELREHRGAGR